MESNIICNTYALFLCYCSVNLTKSNWNTESDVSLYTTVKRCTLLHTLVNYMYML